ncbi:MAG: beta-lactamase family protein [Ignavibacteriaceae bacterium]|nr:beta-lactamase family protein [Ignavibacteriaceae bacterium]
MISSAFAQTNVENKVDSLLNDYTGSNPGAALMVIQNGNVVLEKSYGLADIQTAEKVSAATNFRLASVTKQFTAQAILKLIYEGKLNFNTTLTDIWSDFPEYGKAITIKHILTHTSGLIDYESLIPDTATIQVKDKDVLNMMMLVDSVYFSPGEFFRYSNTGFAILAMMVEKITGISFGDYLNGNIFAPLEMSGTIAFENGINKVVNRAFGNVRTDSGWVKKDQSLTSAVLGDGGIYSSTNDLYKWDQSLYTDKIIPFTMKKESFTRQSLNNGEVFDYGYGWRLTNLNGKEVVYHTGSTIGGRTIIYRIPEKQLTIIFLTNRDEGDTLLIAETIAGYYLE